MMDTEKLFNLVSNDTLNNGVCRVCLQENEHLFNIFESSYDIYKPISTIFEKFFSQKITPGDGYPEVVCTNCLDRGVRALEFKSKFNKATVKDNTESIYPEMDGIILIVQSEDGECVQYTVNDIKQEPQAGEDSIDQIDEDFINMVHKYNTITDKFFCQNCGIPFFTKGALSNHMEKCLSCDICNVTHTNLSDMKIHLSFHKRAQESKCPHCGELLKRGFHSLESFKFPCALCDFIFPCTAYLHQHIESQHNSESETKQPEHIDNKYIEIKKNTFSTRYKCRVCYKTFSNAIRANAHTSSMSCMYVCDICGAVYKVKSQLRIHIMDKHLNIRPHLCCVCGKSFVRRGMLKSHQQVHLQEKNYACNVCGKKFVSAATLRYHSRLHTGEKPYVCSVCGEAFVKCSRLREHEQKWHIGKLQCPKCMTTFSQRCSLKTHMDRFHPNTYDKKQPYQMVYYQPIEQDNVVENITEQSDILISDLNTMFSIQYAPT